MIITGLSHCPTCFGISAKVIAVHIVDSVVSCFSLDIIEIELLCYINSDAQNLKRSDFMHYANLMRFELKPSSAYISYFLQILLQ